MESRFKVGDLVTCNHGLRFQTVNYGDHTLWYPAGSLLIVTRIPVDYAFNVNIPEICTTEVYLSKLIHEEDLTLVEE